ncbi:DnaA N-terminal domain-containing protein [Bacillus mexicanus]|uniref:DnaA N-terminal domain-containing protein n=1 Tax=Bacillus mexicanus TaxID=2834415 RepID=UPI003D19CCFB
MTNEEKQINIDKERISKAFKANDFVSAFTLFRYSDLSLDDFDKLFLEYSGQSLQQTVKSHTAKKDKERIEKALKDGRKDLADLIFETSDIKLADYKYIKASVSSSDATSSSLDEANQTKIWSQITNIIENKLSKPSYEQWFSNLTTSFMAGKLTVYSYDQFQSDWLDSRYKNMILDIAKEDLGLNIKEVEIMCEKNKRPI